MKARGLKMLRTRDMDRLTSAAFLAWRKSGERLGGGEGESEGGDPPPFLSLSACVCACVLHPQYQTIQSNQDFGLF
jgi:hypothetical protein